MGIFKAYDIRGHYGPELNEELAYRIGRYLPNLLGGNRALVGRDARLSSPALAAALIDGLLDEGCDADDIGLSSTPMVYFLTSEKDYDFSIQITASHNPKEDNGFKISRRGSLPVGYETGLRELEYVCKAPPPPARPRGKLRCPDYLPLFTAFLEGYRSDTGSLKIAVDCSDGMGALTAKALFSKSNAVFSASTPDGRFPSHAPNPLDMAGRAPLIELVKSTKSDIGIIFDGDADRVMFVDETGKFISPDLLIAPIADHYLRKFPGAPILHDIRTSRSITEYLTEKGAKPYIWKVGHAYAKLKLREINAPCGGEYAGHYYFRDFHWCDSGEMAALIALGEIAAWHKKAIPFSEYIKLIDRYHSSGEINLKIEDKDAAIARVVMALTKTEEPNRMLDFDGVRLDYRDWWVNIRKSNTEPYLRLLVEANNSDLLQEKVSLIKELIQN